MSWSNNATEILIVLGTAVCFFLSWLWTAKALRDHKSIWRSRLSAVAITAITAGMISWPVMVATVPRVPDGTPDVGAMVLGQAIRYTAAWVRVIVSLNLAAVVIALFGRPKVILPIIGSAAGISLFWIFSTMP